MLLKQLRTNEHKTQKEIADIIGITQFTYCNYETEKTQPDIKTLIALADHFQVSLDYLCERPHADNFGYIPEDRKKIINKILTLNNSQLQRINDIVDGIIIGNQTFFNWYLINI